MEKADKNYLVALSHFPKFGPVRLAKLKNYFPSWEEAFGSPIPELERAGIESGVAAEFSAARKDIDPESIVAKMANDEIRAVVLGDDDYPEALAEIYDPPFILYCRGSLPESGEKILAVVGARKCTFYGQEVIDKIIPELTKNKIIIASGLALGIDSLAQSKTVASGGRTVAVLGSGVDRASIYPAANQRLAEEIIRSGGAVISEFPPGTPPLKQNFPQRNRIIAGLAWGTLIIEAALKSGSLITARCALEEGREVLAVPGNIFSPASEGPNNLIKSGAKPIAGAEDILEAWGVFDRPKTETKKRPDWSSCTLEEQLVLKNLSSEPQHINNLVHLTKLDTKTINSTLSMLEIQGIVRNIGGGNYILI